MRVEGEVALDIVVWLAGSPGADLARALSRALPSAEWMISVPERARVRLRAERADVEPQMGRHWTGLVTGRVELSAQRPPPLPAFKPYVIELPGPPLNLESCWFATDL